MLRSSEARRLANCDATVECGLAVSSNVVIGWVYAASFSTLNTSCVGLDLANRRLVLKRLQTHICGYLLYATVC
jgi:hypothetical protein